MDAVRCRAWVVVALGLLVSGCTDHYRAETRVAPDGRVSRAIYQPEKVTPVDAQKPELWTKLTWAHQISRDEWRAASIAALPIVDREEPRPEIEPEPGAVGTDRQALEPKEGELRPYFAAWGEFASVAELPVT